MPVVEPWVPVDELGGGPVEAGRQGRGRGWRAEHHEGVPATAPMRWSGEVLPDQGPASWAAPRHGTTLGAGRYPVRYRRRYSGTVAGDGWWAWRQPASDQGWRRRLTLDLTQAELAPFGSPAPITVRKIESDERRPSKVMAERLAEAPSSIDESAPRFVATARRRGVPGPHDHPGGHRPCSPLGRAAGHPTASSAGRRRSPRPSIAWPSPAAPPGSSPSPVHPASARPAWRSPWPSGRCGSSTFPRLRRPRRRG